jgi:antitoxin VapB
MAMNIKDPEVHDLARELAERRGVTMTRAVKMALEETLARTGQRGVEVRERLDAIARHCAALPIRDARAADEILGYDDRGLPR